ncbi:MAG: DUF2955 domain-containing protein [Planctomycetes bacterium]|jgi:type III secretory pathway component EscV|nr:DUF2955 domain-containing protein [Planctomycetota bacterium]
MSDADQTDAKMSYGRFAMVSILTGVTLGALIFVFGHAPLVAAVVTVIFLIAGLVLGVAGSETTFGQLAVILVVLLCFAALYAFTVYSSRVPAP